MKNRPPQCHLSDFFPCSNSLEACLPASHLRDPVCISRLAHSPGDPFLLGDLSYCAGETFLFVFCSVFGQSSVSTLWFVSFARCCFALIIIALSLTALHCTTDKSLHRPRGRKQKEVDDDDDVMIKKKSRNGLSPLKVKKN